MSDLPKLYTTEFVAQSFESKKRHNDNRALMTLGEHDSDIIVYRKDSERPRRTKHAKTEERSSSLLGVMAMALVACTLLLVVSLSGTTLISDSWEGIRQVLQSDVPIDEALGKLKFVSSGIAEVFGMSKNDLELPIADPALKEGFDQKSGLIVMTGKAGSDVCSAADGDVALVGENDDGFFVEISHKSNMVTRYGGMAEIFVEEGQPVKQGDAIGKVAEDGDLSFGLNKDGKAVDPVAFFKAPGR